MATLVCHPSYAGWERQFAVDAKANAQELYDELKFQFPKLKDSGGFKLLRASKSGWKGLEVIDILSDTQDI